MRRPDRSVRTVSRRSPGSSTRVSSSLRKRNYVGSSPTISIFLYVAQAVERVLEIPKYWPGVISTIVDIAL